MNKTITDILEKNNPGMMKIANDEILERLNVAIEEILDSRNEDLNKAFSAAVNMLLATENSNFSRCCSFHIKPFNTHWHKKTVKEVMYHVKLYLGSWVVSPMEKALGVNRQDIKNYEQKRHNEGLKRKRLSTSNIAHDKTTPNA